MKYYYILAIILILGVGAVVFGNFYNPQVEQTPKPIITPNPKPEPIFAPEPPDNLKGGIRGTVSITIGNCMPMIIVPGVDDSSSCDDSDTSTSVYIREPATMADMNPHEGVYLDNKPKLVKQVKSNSQGEYQIELEPGDYSVFADDNGKEYCNSFGPYGEACAVTIKSGEYVQYSIVIDHAVW